jgi:hypothetical protein
MKIHEPNIARIFLGSRSCLSLKVLKNSIYYHLRLTKSDFFKTDSLLRLDIKKKQSKSFIFNNLQSF